MLCNSKMANRPDKYLQSSLIKLAFTLVLLTFAIILFLLYPQYYLYLVISCVLITIYSLYRSEVRRVGKECVITCISIRVSCIYFNLSRDWMS